jgi:hypothetical protein
MKCLRSVIALALLAIPMFSQSTPLTASPVQSDPQSSESATFVVPAGTKVLMTSLAALNTISANNESGLYLQTLVNVIEQNRVVIPAGSYVQGSVIRAARPGRIKGRGQLQFHFDTLTLPNNHVLPISGSLASLPGAQYEKKDSGKIQPVDQIDRDASILARPLAGGALLGAIAGGAGGAWRGALIAGAVGGGMVLFKRGDDIHLYQGSRMEMVLDRDLIIPVSRLDFSVSSEKQAPASRH